MAVLAVFGGDDVGGFVTGVFMPAGRRGGGFRSVQVGGFGRCVCISGHKCMRIVNSGGGGRGF